VNTYGAPRRLLSLVLALVLLASSFSVSTVAGQEGEPPEPGGGPSATIYEDSVTPADLGAAVTASIETHGTEGGVDVPLGGTNEPTIAVNPLNGNNIAVAFNVSLRVSTDNGAMFTAPTAPALPVTHSPCGDSSLAFDSQGRLFWTYLGCVPGPLADIFIAQVNPTTGAILAGYPVNVTASPGVNLPAASGFSHDKEWLAADHFPGSASPFRDRLYIVWTQFPGGGAVGTNVRTTFSADQGQNWSAPLTLSAAGEGFVWPSHNAVAPNGDVYVTYHSQPGFAGGSPNGTSGQVFVLRSTDGGASYPQKTTAYTAGNADITFNVQNLTRTLNRSASWTQGSAQPWVLPDPIIQNNVYVVAADDPTNANHGAGFDDMNVFIVRSTNQGVNWNPPAQIDAGPAGTTQFFPTAAIDDRSQCLAVTWYDTRAGVTNAAGNFLLDVFLRNSCDGGLAFGPEVRLNDVRFNPDLGAPVRFAGPPPTTRIGEYNGVAVVNGVVAHAVWTGNTPTGQQIMYDNAVAAGAVDLYFLVDLSGSFTDDLPNFKTQAPTIISTLRTANPNTRFGLGKFEDYPITPFGDAGAGDKAYERLVDLTFDTGAVLSTIAGLSTRSGADLPQSQLPALFQAATGVGQDLSGVGFPGASIPPGQQANFRNGAIKLFLLWTDAAFHQPGDPGAIPYPGPSFADTVNAILALDPPQVIGVSSGTDGIPDLTAMATATGALAPAGGVDCNDDGATDIPAGEPLVCGIAPSGEGIGEAITALVVAATTADLSLTKSDDPDPVTTAQNLTYALTVTNNGPADATGVTLTDNLPAGAAFVSATPSQGSCVEASGTVACDLGDLASGASATITIVVTPTTGGAITNTASVAGNETDPDDTNNHASTDTTVWLVVPIDIKPGSFPNSINLNTRGTIPVAILSAADFDAPNKVDKTSLTFGRTGDERSLAFCTKGTEDVNRDGHLDQVCHFYTRVTGFQPGDITGVLKGQTVEGVIIIGTDSVRIVR